MDHVDEAVARSIRATEPDVLCVALGNPKQERFIGTYGAHLGCPVMIGIGGSLDMLVGDKQRAPDWVQRVGAEWVFRAAQEPRRLGRRYLHDISVFGPQLLTYWRSARRFRSADALLLNVAGDVVTVTVSDVATTWTDPLIRYEDGRPKSVHLQLAAPRELTPSRTHG